MRQESGSVWEEAPRSIAAHWAPEQEAQKVSRGLQQATALKQAGPWASLDLNTRRPNVRAQLRRTRHPQ